MPKHTKKIKIGHQQSQGTLVKFPDKTTLGYQVNLEGDAAGFDDNRILKNGTIFIEEKKYNAFYEILVEVTPHDVLLEAFSYDRSINGFSYSTDQTSSQFSDVDNKISFNCTIE